MVMVIVGTIHTGRRLTPNRWIDISVALIIVATLLRSLIPFALESASWLYLASALLWALPFVIYLLLFFPFLSRPRADGLPG